LKSYPLFTDTKEIMDSIDKDNRLNSRMIRFAIAFDVWYIFLSRTNYV